MVDMRRSGINGLISLRERVVLPRISDVAESVSALMKSASWGDACEAMISDFKDAFCSLPLHVEEQPFAVIKGNSLYYLLKTVVFGVASGPLLWARLASWGMCISQAVACCSECKAQCFVDDPIMLACGGSERQRTRSFARYLLSWTVLGFEIAGGKVARGVQVDWIGVRLKLPRDQVWVLEVTLSEAKTRKLLDLLEELLQVKGMVATAKLEHAAGVLGWVSSIIPVARP